MESYILTQSMHLGHLKESFGKGAVIRFNEETRRMTIDGRAFEDARDLEVLKSHDRKKPHTPWLVPYSEENLAVIRGESMETASPVKKRAPNGEGMEIVISDEDMHDTIDISDTKVGARNNERKEAERQRVKDHGMEIIQGDEGVEERIARLKDAKDTDISARAERVRLMSEGKAKMPIVHDDSLGAGAGSSSVAMNAGMPVGGRRAEEASEQVAAAAAARKSEVEMNRQKIAGEHGLDPDQAGIDEATIAPAPSTPVTAEVETEPVFAGDDKDEELASLRAQLESTKAVPVVDPRDAEIAALKAELAEKSTRPKHAKKTPLVTAED